MNAPHHVPAKLRAIREIVEEYETKRDAIPQLIADFEAAITALQSGATIGGTYVGQITDARAPYEDRLRLRLRQSAWQHVFNGLNLEQIAPASDRKRFEHSFTDPPEFTLDNIAATFGAYVEDPRFHVLRGLAECFSDLDPAFKSHSKVKIGVEGLPKRVIISNVSSYGGWGFERLIDLVKALRAFDGEPWTNGYREVNEAVDRAKRCGEAEVASLYATEKDGQVRIPLGLRLKVFQNGNGHLHFSPERLRSVNLALAEFYGDVLPDSPEAMRDPDRDLFRSREVSTDLAYYPTPPNVADRVVEAALDTSRVPEFGWRVLEPSCGDGQLLDAVMRWSQRTKVPVAPIGIEVQPKLAREAERKGHAVQIANFLQVPPPHELQRYDRIVMNPPFAGQHWQKHLMHARKFLKRDGFGVCILPASALVDGHLDKLGVVDRGNGYGYRDRWKDLPIASFRASGTNVSTGYLTFFAEER